MKRAFALVLALLLCASLSIQAKAEENALIDLSKLREYEGWEVTDYVRPNQSDWAFLALKSGLQNSLAGFKLMGGVWQEQFVNFNAVPQGEMRIRFQDVSGISRVEVIGDEFDFDNYKYGTAFSCYWSNGETRENCCTFELEEDTFYIVDYSHWGQSGLINIKPDELIFFEAYTDVRRVKLKIRREIARFNLAQLPKNERQATQPDVLPPTLADGWLRAKEIPLPGRELIPVFSAPGKDALRLADGKAALSPKGWVMVFGTEGDSAMVLYGISPGRYRAGYIKASHLPDWYEDNPLNFTRVKAKVIRQAEGVEGLSGVGEVIAKLKPGQEVTLLSRIGVFAYYEGTLNKKTYRAVAPLNAFDQEPSPPVGMAAGEITTRYGRELLLLTAMKDEQTGSTLWYDARLLSPFYNGNYWYFWPVTNQLDAPLGLRFEQAGTDFSIEDLRQDYQDKGYDIRPLDNRLPEEGFIAVKEGQCEEIRLHTGVHRLLFTLHYPERAKDTWRIRLLYTVETLTESDFN